jgi:hypothetical protein
LSEPTSKAAWWKPTLFGAAGRAFSSATVPDAALLLDVLA